MGLVEVSSDKLRSIEVNSDKSRSVRVSLSKLRSVRISSDKLRLVKINSDKLRLIEINQSQFIIRLVMFSHMISSNSCYVSSLRLELSHKDNFVSHQNKN